MLIASLFHAEMDNNNKMMCDMNFCVNIEHIQNCNENKTILLFY